MGILVGVENVASAFEMIWAICLRLVPERKQGF